MRTVVRVNPDFKELKDFMKKLPVLFDKQGDTLKDDRNEIKVIEHKGLKLCIKSFKRVTTFNRYMYSWFRATKAKRSYCIARTLIKRGMLTPTPVGYVEVYGKGGILQKAFYLSLFYEYEYDLSDVLEKNLAKQEAVLSAFARYMAEVVHPAGVWHNDLNANNVLINSVGKDEWSFSFIDLNRTKIRATIPPVRGLQNFKKLTRQPVALTLVAEQYALAAERNPQIYSIFLMRRNFLYFIRRFYTKRVLSIFKPKKRRKKNNRHK